MSDVPISQLPLASSLNDGDSVPIVQDGVTKRVLGARVARSGANTDITSVKLGAPNANINQSSDVYKCLLSAGWVWSNNASVPPGFDSTIPRGLSVLRETGGGGEVHAAGGGASVFRLTTSGDGQTLTNPTVPTIGNAGYLVVQGWDGANWTGRRAAITFSVGSTWTPTSTPTAITFETTGTGSTASTGRWVIGSSGHLAPVADNTYSLGGPASRPTALWAVSGTISTSDAREKTPVRGLKDAELTVAKALVKEIGFYKFLTAVAEKGDAARGHIGMTVQRAIELFEANGLDPFAYSFICYDSWEGVDAVVAPEPEDCKAAIPAGDRYSFREGGLMMFMIAGLAARIEELEG